MENLRANIIKEVLGERKYQEERWGNKADDTLNTPNDFVSYIAHHSTRWFNGGFTPYPENVVEDFRTQMIKVAAIAVAAVESLDRQIVENGKPFYEDAA